MAVGAAMHIYRAELAEGYTVKTLGGCRLVFGNVPANDVAMLVHGFTRKALMALDIADRVGATFVIGEPDDLEALRKLDLPVSPQRLHDYSVAVGAGVPETVRLWLRDGERGVSSNALCKRLFGVPETAGTAHPHDPADLRLCLQLLTVTQTHDRIAELAEVSPQWARLVACWSELAALFAEESAKGTKLPRTYARMQEALK